MNDLTLGAVGFNHPAWELTYYPEDLPPSWRLHYFANDFDCCLLTLQEQPFVIAHADELLDELPSSFGYWLQYSVRQPWPPSVCEQAKGWVWRLPTLPTMDELRTCRQLQLPCVLDLCFSIDAIGIAEMHNIGLPACNAEAGVINASPVQLLSSQVGWDLRALSKQFQRAKQQAVSCLMLDVGTEIETLQQAKILLRLI